MTDPTQICRGFTDDQWRQLRSRLNNRDQSAWNCAIQVFERRITERFLSCIDVLIAADSRSDIVVTPNAPADSTSLPRDTKQIVVPGFAIMGLCCLLAETLQSFRHTPANVPGVTGPSVQAVGPVVADLFREFLKLPAFNNEFSDDRVATAFVNGVRNGILHEAETRRWLIWREDPPGQIVGRDGRKYVINRTKFYQALVSEFRAYLSDLGDDRNVELRARFVKKMSDIAKES
jgi:hypothetical protein